MKKIIVVLVILAVLAGGYLLFKGSDKKSETVQQATVPVEQSGFVENQVTIQNFSFSPAEISVKVGTTVAWTNKDTAPHTITSDEGGVLNSKTLNTGDSFTFIFDKPGEYNYICSIHPSMRGKVIVTP